MLELIGFDPKTRTFDAAKGPSSASDRRVRMLARLLREQVEPRQPKVADLVMDQLVAANKDSFKPICSVPAICSSTRKATGSKEDLAVALKLAPDDPDVILVAAQAAMIDKKLDDSQALLTRGLKLYPKNVNMYRQWAVLKSTENKLGEAAAEVEKGLKLTAAEIPTCCGFSAKSGCSSAISPPRRATLATLAKTNYPKPLVELMEARILFFEGKWREAAQQFERLRPQLAQIARAHQANRPLCGQCYGQLGEYDKQLDACRRVLQSDPTSYHGASRHRTGVDGNGQNRGSPARPTRRLARAVGKDKAMSIPQIWRPIVQLRMDEQMRLPKDQRNWSGVDAIIKLLDKDVAPGDKEPDKAAQSAIVLMKAEVELRKGQGNIEQARQLLLDAKSEVPDGAAVWSALATITYPDGSVRRRP